jgi:hypothetical protein
MSCDPKVYLITVWFCFKFEMMDSNCVLRVIYVCIDPSAADNCKQVKSAQICELLSGRNKLKVATTGDFSN